MTLTEQWKKGELPEGWYYINSSYYANGSLMWCEGGIFIACGDIVPTERITEVLAPVPSYEKYTSLVNWKEDLTKICTAKERIIEKYENIDTWWKAEYTELKEQNTKLKELLKECVEYVKKGYGDYLTYTQSAIYQEINQALGEDK